MRREPQKQLHQLIQRRAKTILDQAEREAVVLHDQDARDIAGKLNSSVHEVYTEALRFGVTPYRYVRNREAISLQEQLRLAESKVAVVGAGGLGGQVILLLARVGVGHLIVIDHDLFEETNLNRQALCDMASLGRPKPEVAAEVVGSVNPGVIVTPFQGRLDSPEVPKILSACNAVVDALDNIPDRLILEGIARELEIPLVHGALAGFEGWMMTIFPDDPGLKLLYGGQHQMEHNLKSPEAMLGVPALTPSIIAGLQAMEVLKIILKRGKIFRRIMVHVDLETGQLDEFVCETRSH